MEKLKIWWQSSTGIFYHSALYFSIKVWILFLHKYWFTDKCVTIILIKRDNFEIIDAERMIKILAVFPYSWRYIVFTKNKNCNIERLYLKELLNFTQVKLFKLFSYVEWKNTIKNKTFLPMQKRAKIQI